MKVLIVSAYFNPPTNLPRGNRTAELVKEFSRRGDTVTVLLPKSEYDYSSFQEKYPNVEFRFTKHSNAPFKDCRNKFLQKFVRLYRGGLYRLFLYPNYRFLQAIPKSLKNDKGYDITVSVAYPFAVHFGVNKAIKQNPYLTKCWVADCSDPFTFIQYSKIAFYFNYFEKAFCRTVDYLIVPTKDSIEGYYPEFRDKIRVIPQGFNFNEVKIEQYKPNDVITFAFAGRFYKFRDPGPIIDQIAKITDNFVFKVYTNSPEFLTRPKAIYGDKIEINGFISREELLKEMSKVDFVMNIENSGISVQTPSKLIDYYLTQRPIISLDCNNIDVENLEKFLNRDYSGALKIENPQQYNIVNICNELEKLSKESV